MIIVFRREDEGHLVVITFVVIVALTAAVSIPLLLGYTPQQSLTSPSSIVKTYPSTTVEFIDENGDWVSLWRLDAKIVISDVVTNVTINLTIQAFRPVENATYLFNWAAQPVLYQETGDGYVSSNESVSLVTWAPRILWANGTTNSFEASFLTRPDVTGYRFIIRGYDVYLHEETTHVGVETQLHALLEVN